ncbi:type II secretion system protein GspE [bacterium]|nr:MAG: type II secretion system protein GspE [bacterium]RKZ23296.1 MAG: type II secretion system protein GspE [bacterium]
MRDRVTLKLIEEGVLAPSILQEMKDANPDREIFKRKLVPDEVFLSKYAELYGYKFLEKIDRVDDEFFNLLPYAFWKKRKVVPLKREANKAYLATANPFDIETFKDVEFITESHVEIVLVPEREIKRVLEEKRPKEEVVEISFEEALENLQVVEYRTEEQTVLDLQRLAREPPIIRLVNFILLEGIKKEATDIHIEPLKNFTLVRFRIDGVLYEFAKFPKKIHPSIVSRIKIMGKMKLAERRKPQDGEATILFENREIYLRISALPSIYGEKVVLRILDYSRVGLGLEDLGFLPESLRLIKEMLSSRYGMILATGPTGSGKTTTLYAILNRIKTGETNIITVEDPVEYKIEGITQVEVKNEQGLTFASVLRSILRQDPDVILVGEIRDKETTEIALNAALTGHLVLSTLHTNDAVSAFQRFYSLGSNPEMVSEVLRGVIAQRLVRKICPYCAEEVVLTPEELEERWGLIASEPVKVRVARGCDKCNGSGYKGRTAVEEVIRISDALRPVIAEGGGAGRIKEVLKEEGFQSMSVNAVKKVLMGITTFDEAARVVEIRGVKIEETEVVKETGFVETRKKVMVIDDSPTLRKIVKSLLSDEFEVLEAQNGKEGFEKVISERPDLVILDVMMPEMDGFEVLQQIRNYPETKDTLVLMLTSKNTLEDELKGFELGADDYLPKPFHPEKLVARVKALLSGRR